MKIFYQNSKSNCCYSTTALQKLGEVKYYFASLILVLFLFTGTTLAQTSNYLNDFETSVGADNWGVVATFQAVTIVASGTNGVVSSSGAFHGEAPSLPGDGSFTRFGHSGGGSYNSVFPCSGYKTSLDFYLDVNGGESNDTRVDYTSAINNAGGTHRRDFVFAIGFYDDAVAPGTGNRFVVSASNNTPGWPKDPGRSPQVISTSGWYKFEHHFKNVAGVLVVDMTIYDATNTPVASWSLSDGTDLIGVTVGGARYGWILNNAFGLLPVDNSALTLNATSVHNITQGTNFCSIQAAIDDGATTAGDQINVDAGTYNESVNINKAVNLRGVQADNCAPTRVGAESIINAVNGIGINASGVILNGFTIQGQTNTNSAPGFGYAVYMVPPNTGTQLINNIIKNNVVGSSISNAGASPAQVVVQCNWFDSNNNAGPASGAGIYTDEYTGGGIISNVLINNNKFSGHIYDGGIDFSVSQASQAATGITITNNDFDGNRRAAFLYNVVSSTFSNNILHNSNGAGTGDVRIYGGVNNLSVNNNFFIGNGGSPSGIRISNDGGPNNSNITVFENSFTGYSNIIKAINVVSGYPGSLNAMCNWWETAVLANIPTVLSGTITYVPFVNSGTDNLPGTNGFQPLPNSCICPSITFGLTATTSNGSSATGNTTSGPVTLAIDFCLGSSFTFFSYSSIPGPKVGFMEVITGTAPAVVLYNNSLVPVPRTPTDIKPSQVAGYFTGPYGPYSLSAGTSGQLIQKYTPYYDANGSNSYDVGECLGDTLTLIYNVTAPVINTCPVTRNLTGCSLASLPGYSVLIQSSSYAAFSGPPNNGVATSQCSPWISVTYFDVASQTCPIVVTRKWKLQDLGLNVITCDQTININQPNTPPVVTPATGSSTVQCETSATAPTPPTVTDVCGAPITPSGPVRSGTYDTNNPTCEGTVIYTWTYTDCAGLASTYVYTYTVDHSTAPVVTPATGSSNVQCETSATAPTPPTVTDVCGAPITPTGPVRTGTYDTNNPTCEGTVIYTWTYTDCAGLASTYVYTYTVDHSTAPVVTPATGSSNVECEASATAPTPPTVTDVCSAPITPTGPVRTGTYDTNNPTCEGTVIYTWTYTDCAGLASTYVYTYTVDHSTAPVVTPATGSSNVECEASATAPTPPTVTDVCDAPITPSGPVRTGTYDTNNPTCEGTVIYTWTYTDCAGLASTYVYTYTVDHSTAPVVTPATGSSNVECEASATAPTPPTVTDVCSAPITPSGPVRTGTYDTNNPTCEGTVIYTWTYTDCAGLASTYVYTYTVDHSTAPVVTPATGSSNVECEASATAPTPPTVTDVCSAPITPSGPVRTGTYDTNNPTCEGTVIYTWTYTDCAGLASTYVYTYTVDHSTAPVVTPATGSSNVQCETSATAPTPPTVTDVCSAPITPSGPVRTGTYDTNNPTCEGTVIYTWTYTDCAGLASTYVYTYTVDHSTAPVVTPATGSSNVECEASATAPTPPTVTDVCSAPITPSGPVRTGTYDTNNPTCEGTVIYTWTYTDCAGLASTYVYTYTVDHSTAPVVTPATGSSNVQCETSATAPTPPTVTDVCSAPITPTGPVRTGTYDTNNPTCEGTVIYTWTYTDCAGLASTYVYTYTVDHSTAPVVPANGAFTVECIPLVGSPAPAVTDVCNTAITPFGPVMSGSLVNTQTIVTDASWALSTVNPSSGLCPATVWAGVGGVLPSTATYTLPVTIGNYLNATILVTGTSGLLTGSNVRFYRKTFNLTTLAGIQATLLSSVDNAIQIYINGIEVAFEKNLVVQNFNDGAFSRVILNSTGSNFNNGAGFQGYDTYTLTNAASIFVLGTNEIVLAAANCGGGDQGTTSFKATINTTQGCEGTIIYNYTYTDCSGLSTPWSETYTIDHTTAPVVSPSSGASNVECETSASAPTPPSGIVDVCGAPITPSGPVRSGTYDTNNPTCEGTVIYTWTYTDCAALASTYVYTYTVDHSTAPVVTPATGSSNVECEASATAPTPPTVTDVCSAPITPTGPVRTGTYDTNNPTCEGTVIYTWTYTDCAGLASTYVYTYTVDHSTAPVVTPATGSSNVECEASATAPTPPTVTDVCSAPITPSGPVRTGTYDTNNPTCEGTVIYTWTYTDCAGLASTYVYTYTVDHSTAPVVTPATGSSNVECEASATAPTPPTVTDVCSAPITPSGPVRTGTYDTNNPTCEGTVIYTWTYTDCAGLASTYVYTYTVDHSTAPVVTPATGSSNVECEASATAPTPPTVTDVCSAPITPSGPVRTGTYDTNNPTCEGTVIYTWTYTDCAGLASTYVYTYTVDHSTAPVVTPATGSSNVECEASATAPTPPTVTDVCSAPITPSGPVRTGTYDTNNPTCEGTVIYTWTYTDCAGLASTYVYTYTVDHSTAPVVTPATGSSNVECEASATAPTPPTVTDVCSAPITPSGPVRTGTYDTNNPTCEGTVIYTWTYTDCAGLASTYVYTYTVDHSTAPVVTPAIGSSNVECEASANAPTPPTVTDVCDAPITPTGPVRTGTYDTNNPTCEGTVIYTWTYTDCAGLASTYVYTYTVDHSTAPVVTPATGASTVQCAIDAKIPIPPSVVDVCGTAVPAVLTNTVDAPDPLTCEGTRTYTFTYTDCSGLTSNYVYTYTIDHTTAPVVTPPVGASTVQCPAHATTPVPPAVVDVCGAPVAAVLTNVVDAPDPVSCEGTRTYTFTYTDCSGLTSTYVYTYTIDHTTAPVVPADGAATVTCVPCCIQPNPAPVFDVCGTVLIPVITITDSPSPLVCTGTRTYTFTYTDCSGLVSVWKFVYTVTIDDNNLCTIDACDPISGVTTHTQVPRSDGNACTLDACDPVFGVFHITLNVNDGNLCTYDACNTSTGAITHTPVNTDDNNFCTTDGCNSQTGVYHTQVDVNDNNPCTVDGCDSATGVYHTAINPDDGNACTADACNTTTGAVTHIPADVDDSNACTTDACNPTTGNITHTPVNTDDGNGCTADACNSTTGQVTHIPLNVDDGNACTTDACNPANGNITHTVVIVDDGNACTDDACNTATGQVTHIPLNVDDGNPCTTDACNPSNGNISHTVVNVDDGNACTDDACNTTTGQVTHVPSVNIDDGNACTYDGCDTNGAIYHQPINPDDGNPCTNDACNTLTGVVNTPIPTTDGNACTTDICDAATGVVSHIPVDSDDNNPCTADACNTLTGALTHVVFDYSDGNACTDDGCNTLSGVFNNPVSTDDGNPCTIDACNTGSGAITHTAVNVDDGNACTNDACNSTTGGISHVPVNVDDSNPCTTDACNPANGNITHTPVDPDDGNPCTNDACNSTTGGITHVPVSVDDGNVCTEDACNPANGSITHTAISVDDGNPCTTDACNSVTGITHTSIPVDDGNACTTDICDASTGTILHLPVDSDDNNPCTADACNTLTGAITHVAFDYSDGNACTNDGCTPSTGVFHNPVNIDDSNPCTIDACNTFSGAITHTALNVDDGNICTTDACNSTTGGISHVPVNNSDNNSCTIDGCDPVTGVFHVAININDGNSCTDDACNSVTGQISHIPVNVDDGNVCTTDACNPASGNITHIAISVDDGNPCTTDACHSITGITHTPVPVNDGNACTTDICDAATGVVSHIPVDSDDNNPCTADACNTLTGAITHVVFSYSDGNACTTDGCNTLSGVFNNPVSTDDGNPCTIDACNTGSGVITNTAVNVNDGNVCTTDGCNSTTGAITHVPVNTDDNNDCTIDLCDPVTGVIHVTINSDDGNACTTDACNTATGAITHFPVNVDDGNVCTTDACNPTSGVITNTAISTEDNNICTTDGCNSITGPFHTPVSFDDGNPCTTDGCDAFSGPYHFAVDINDNDACTTDACNSSTGVITHTAINSDDGNICTTDGCDKVTGNFHTPVSIDDGNACTNDYCDVISGVYHVPVYISDDDNCTIDACNTLTGAITHTNDSPTISVTVGSIDCYGGTACVTVSATGGTTPYVGTGIFCGYGMGTYSFEVADSKGCIVSSGDVNITEPDKLSVNVSSTPAGCNTSDGTATATVVGGTPPYSYLWIPSGQTTSTATNLPAGNYTVQVTDDNGCSVSKVITVGSSGSAPGAPGPISGPDGVCKKASGIVYCVTPVPGATSYSWTLPPGASVTGSANGNCITLQFSTKFKGGYICVKACNPCGSSAYVCKNVVLVASYPAAPAAIFGPATLCPLGSGNYSIAAIPNATSYIWTATGGLVIVSGQGTTDVVITAPAGFTNGTIKARGSNCKGTGGYKAMNIVVGSSCRIAANRALTNDQVDLASALSELTVFPNPTSGKVSLTFISDRDARYSLKVMNVLGNIMINEDLIVLEGYNMKAINLENVAKGLYFISIQTEGAEAKTLRIIVE